MMVERSIHRLQGGRVLAECGPMKLVISAFQGMLPRSDIATKAAMQSFAFLDAIARDRLSLGENFRKFKSRKKSVLVARMGKSVTAVGDEDLKPLAAVAGTIADAVADFLFSQGMTKVVVENGGDISIRIQTGETVAVGIRPNVDSRKISHVITLDPARSTWGVATSGLGGRSLTRGIASAVTVVAKNASLADAAATAIANASFVKDEQVLQHLAVEVDPYTDIPSIPVTIKVGPLSEPKKRLAVEQSLGRAQELISRKVILGALVAVQGMIATTDSMKCLMMKDAVENGQQFLAR